MGQGENNMREAVNCFKFDMRIMKAKMQYIYLILIPIFTFIMMKYIDIGLAAFMFFAILYIGMPFANENGDKLENIYSLLPNKYSSIVWGRFMYLSLTVVITICILGGTSLYYFNFNSPELLFVTELIIVVNISVILMCISYPLYYEAQKSKRDVIKTALLIIASLVILSFIIFIPIEMKEAGLRYSNQLNCIGNLIINNKKSFIVLNLLSIGCICYLSYKVSCWIFYRKEV